MKTSEKGKLIGQIVQELRISAMANGDKAFCEGDTFFSLAFKSDAEVLRIAKLCGINA